MRMRCWLSLLVLGLGRLPAPAADSDPAHQASEARPLPWPGGVIPYDISKLTATQQSLALRAMQRWMDTGAKIKFTPRANEVEYVNFTGQTNAGNNTSHVGFLPGKRTDINITAFWWRGNEWMPTHELGHVLGFFHEHQRWDRDQYLTVHYEHIKPGRASDYDWIARTNWLVSTLPYDYKSIMHYRVCWASACESECQDAVGSSPCAVLSPVNKQYDAVIGQWTDNGLSPLDAGRARLAYGTNAPSGRF